MANHLQRGEEAEAYHPEENSALPYLWGIGRAEKERLLGESVDDD